MTSTLDLVDAVHHNTFLKSIFPNGISRPIFINRITIIPPNKVEMDVQTKEEPRKKIPQWGEWLVNYNTVVIKVSADLGNILQISKTQTIESSPIQISRVDGVYTIKQEGKTSLAEIEMKNIIFLECTTYLNEE